MCKQHIIYETNDKSHYALFGSYQEQNQISHMDNVMIVCCSFDHLVFKDVKTVL